MTQSTFNQSVNAIPAERPRIPSLNTGLEVGRDQQGCQHPDHACHRLDRHGSSKHSKDSVNSVNQRRKRLLPNRPRISAISVVNSHGEEHSEGDASQGVGNRWSARTKKG